MPNSLTPPAPDIWTPFWEGIRGAIVAAWPEVFGPTHPIYRVTQVERRNWRQSIQDGKWESPWVIVQIPPAREVPGFGACNVVYQPVVRIYYVTENLQPDMGAFLEGKLADLQLAVLNANGNGFQLMYEFEIDLSEQNPANLLFLDQNLSFMAGSLAFKTMIGYIVE